MKMKTNHAAGAAAGQEPHNHSQERRYCRNHLPTDLVDLQGLDLAGVPDMGASAKVDEGPAST